MRRLTLLLLMLLGTAAGAEWRIASGPERAVMIELFTSEGCSSCPPAEAFLNRFADNPRLWKSFIPLAFHVDYWDYLGWQDRYALADNAVRQRRYARLGHVRGVYTPGFLVNGRGWRPGWFGNEPPGDTTRAGQLSVAVANGRLTARYDAGTAQPAPLQLHLAVLGMGLQTAIRAGENAGRHSRHDFVVLDHQRLAGDGSQWSGVLPQVRRLGAGRLALVAWLQRAGDPTPVQAVGGYLPAAELAD
jgi:hypothetical protein